MIDVATIRAYDAKAAAFARDWEQEQAPPTDLQEVLRKYFRPGLTADVGCGSGRETAWLCANGYPAIGFDPSEGLLAEAQRRHPGLRFERAALPKLDGVEEAAFANVLCETVIMHLEQELIGSAVRRLVTLLETGGTLYLSWRVTEHADRRDEHGRLYAAFDSSLVVGAISEMKILLDEEIVSASSGKVVHRIVARKK